MTVGIPPVLINTWNMVDLRYTVPLTVWVFKEKETNMLSGVLSIQLKI
jgi:hypothetical protein